jgi:replicative DNA helicase
LNEGLPRPASIDSYVKIVADKGMLRRMIAACRKAEALCVEASEEPGEIVAQVESDVLKVAEASIRGAGLSIEEAVEQYRGGYQVLTNPASAARGIQTHIARYNDMTGGLHAGELTLIAGRPSHGKTAFALGLALAVAREERNVVLFSLEMSKEALLGRLACMLGRVDSHCYRMGRLDADGRQSLSGAIRRMLKLSIVIDDQPVTNVSEIGAKLRRERQRRGLDIAIIDYLGLITSPGKSENRNQEVSAISRALKLMARDLNVPLVALCQLSRDNEKGGSIRRPHLSDLRDSGSLEQDADVVAFCHREAQYKPDRDDLAGLAEVIISKQRNGPTGIINCAWVGKYSSFETLEGA